MEEGLASPGAAYSAWRIGILGSLGLVEAWVGRLERAQAVADEALSVARDVGILTHPVTADAFLATSLVALQRGQEQAAFRPWPSVRAPCGPRPTGALR